MQMFAYIAGFRASTGNAHLCCTGSENPILFISEHLLSRCQMQRSSGQEMKLISFSFFLLLLQTLRGIEGDVQCGNNNSVSNCRFCLLASPPAPFGIDMRNCNASPDCMLNDDSSDCVNRPTQPSSLPVDAEDNDTNPTSNGSSSAPSAPEQTGQEPLVSATEEIGEELLPSAPADIGQGFLSTIKVSLTPNMNEPIRQYGVQVQVCNGENCCRTDPVFSRGGILTFTSAFNNFANCGQVRRRRDLSVMVVKSSQEYYPLHLNSVTITFGDGSAFRKQADWTSCRWTDWNCQPQIIPLQWGVTYGYMHQIRSQAIPTQAPPAPQCPEVINPNANACPRANVRVHQMKRRQERRSCYYQR